MNLACSVLYYLGHVQELRSMILWKIRHYSVHKRDLTNDNLNTRKCFHYLNKTSRGFVAIVEELHPELLMPMCLCYLTLRGLDTIEDDTSISAEEKEPDLRNFDKILEVDGWNFTKNRPEEKDRDLLVNFDCVIQDFKALKQEYKDIIKDITHKMGNGMADYCLNTESNEGSINTIKDYDSYCYYVAGLVGEGSTRMFVESKLGDPALLSRPHLIKSMGLFLQKTNIIRDIREDFDDNRRFYPCEIWSKHVEHFEDLFKSEHMEAALACSSEMVLNALGHAVECLIYLDGLREQSVFNFCAIPQAMAIATLALCFRNPEMFKGNIKIRKGEACQCMLESTRDFKALCNVFRKYTRIVRKKNVLHDPNFWDINIVCGRIERYIDSKFPTVIVQSIVAKGNFQKKVRLNAELTDPIEALKTAETRTEEQEIFMFNNVVISVMVLTVPAMLLVAYLFRAYLDRLWQDLGLSQIFDLRATLKGTTTSKSTSPSLLSCHGDLQLLGHRPKLQAIMPESRDI